MTKRKADPISDAAEARIQAAIARDPERFANLTWCCRPRSEASWKLVTLRLPPDVIAGYQASGPGWQVRMGEVLAAGLATDRTVRKAKRR